jgi:HEAT repeat protein
MPLNTVRSIARIVFSGAILLVACREKEQFPSVTPDESAKATTALASWLECVECQSGELEAVIRYSHTIVPMLTAVLRDGASPATRELLERQLSDRYALLAAYATAHPESGLSSKEEFIANFLNNFDAQHRIRASRALAEIGGEDAERALQEAVQKADNPRGFPEFARNDVSSSLSSALARIQKP